MPPRRYDVYGFRTGTLAEAAKMVERVLGIRLRLRDSSYRGLYFSGPPGIGQSILLEENVEGSRWHKQFGEVPVTLMISEQPDMDALHERFKAQGDEPALLHTIFHTEEPSEVLEPNAEDEETEEPAAKS